MLSLLFTTLAILCFTIFNKYHTLNKNDILTKSVKPENYSIHNIDKNCHVANYI